MEKMVALQNEIIVLGSGTSTGIPTIGCNCKVCKSDIKKNKRLRSSLFLRLNNQKKIIIDTTPDLRTQFLNNNIDDVDAAFITHDHADHIHGIDDLRPIGFKKENYSIPIYTSNETASILETRFSYIFQDHENKSLGGGIPRLHLNVISKIKTPVTILDQSFTFFLLPHGIKNSLAFQHQNFAYLPDCHEVPDEILTYLAAQKLDLLIITCVQRPFHNTHLTLDKSFHYIDKIAAKNSGLIHMNHDLDHDELTKITKNTFKTNVFPLYDNQHLFY